MRRIPAWFGVPIAPADDRWIEAHGRRYLIKEIGVQCINESCLAICVRVHQAGGDCLEVVAWYVELPGSQIYWALSDDDLKIDSDRMLARALMAGDLHGGFELSAMGALFWRFITSSAGLSWCDKWLPATAVFYRKAKAQAGEKS